VSEITGMERSALYERIQRGEFPKPIQIGSAAVSWIEAEVVARVQQQIDASRTQQPAKGARRGRA
jgi:prophage regulatory protein